MREPNIIKRVLGSKPLGQKPVGQRENAPVTKSDVNQKFQLSLAVEREPGAGERLCWAAANHEIGIRGALVTSISSSIE